MMKRFARIAAITCLLVTTVVATVPQANATVTGIYKTDGNDTPGPLDLESVRLSAVDGGDKIQIATLASFTKSQLDGSKGWIEVDFDLDANGKYDFYVVVYYYKQKLYAVEVVDGASNGTLPVKRVNTRTIAFTIKHSGLGFNVTSYDFAAASIWRAAPCSKSEPCIDTIPNRLPLLRSDFTAPTVTWLTPPKFTTDVSDTLTFPLEFTVKDDKNGSGVQSWDLEKKLVGIAGWTVIETGSNSSVTAQVTVPAGDESDYRVVAVDRQGNRRTSTSVRITAPYDDVDPLVTYGGSVTHHASLTGPFLGTATSMATSSTATITLPTYWRMCVLAGPTGLGESASADISINGLPEVTVTETSSTPLREMHCIDIGASEDIVMVITVTSADNFVLDGIALFPF